jgi:hypothetical protein
MCAGWRVCQAFLTTMCAAAYRIWKLCLAWEYVQVAHQAHSASVIAMTLVCTCCFGKHVLLFRA